MADAPDPVWSEIAHQAQIDAFVGPEMYQTGSEIALERGLVMVKGRVNHSWFNVVFQTSDELSADDAMTRAAGFFGFDPYMVFARDWAGTPLVIRAQDEGLTPKSPVTYMIADTRPPNVEIPEWLTIHTRPSQKLAKDFGQVAAAVFGENDDDVAAVHELFVPGQIFTPYSQYFVAYVDKKPVAITSLWLSRLVPGIYWVGTLPEYRKRGIAEILVKAAWSSAMQVGARAVTLQASEAGHPLYLRLGFRDVGTFTRLG